MEERGGRVGGVGREWRKSCSLVLPFFSTISILRMTFFSLSFSTDNFFNRTVLGRSEARLSNNTENKILLPYSKFYKKIYFAVNWEN